MREAKKCHPDVNPSPESKERFQELGEAYYVLGDRVRRANHDSVGSQAPPRGARRSSSGSQQQAAPNPGAGMPGEKVDPYELFRAVLEELGVEDAMRYLTNLQRDASHAIDQVKNGDLQPAREFAWNNKSLFVGVVVPAAILLRSPGLVAMAFRPVLAFTAYLLANRNVLEWIVRLALIRWRAVFARAVQRTRSRKK